MVLDHSYLVGDWRLAQVERTLRPFFSRWDGVRYRQLLDEFGLDLRARIKDLSRGMATKLTVAIQFPLFIRFGYSRIGLPATTLPLALILVAVARLHLTIVPMAWLPYVRVAGAAAIAASVAVAVATDRRI